MLFKELVEPESRLYAKSEWTPAGPLWPALSFSLRAVANEFSRIYTRGRDFIITVGTGNPKDTQNPAHRQALLSIVDAEPRMIVNTGDLVDAEEWKKAQEAHPERWKLSMPIVRAWTFTDFPKAREKMTATYSRFANPTTRGRPIRVDDIDRLKLAELELTPAEIPALIEHRVQAIAVAGDRLLNQDLTRIVQNIVNSVGRSGSERGGVYPERNASNFSDLYRLVRELWHRQEGRCKLCGGLITLGGDNPLLKMSADRIDSANKTYDASNVHIAHMGCNLAKSDATLVQWQEFLGTVRYADDVADEE